MGSDGVRERAAGGSRSSTVACGMNGLASRIGKGGGWGGQRAYPAIAVGPFGDEGLGGLGDDVGHFVFVFSDPRSR